MSSLASAAVPAGADARLLVRQIAQARDSFLTSGVAPRLLRPVVAQSWRRSLSLGLDPQAVQPPVELDGEQLRGYRSAHPLAAALPVVRRLLVDQAAEAGLLVAMSDDAGRLLWVEGASTLRRRAERMAFVEGACWSEARAGTNAPGTALALGQPVQIFAAEHLASVVTGWSCAAAPVHGPDGRVLGAIDITGGDEVAGVATMLLVRATVAAVEAELRACAPAGAAPAASTAPRLEVLGRRSGVAVNRAGATGLRLRHAELMLLLSAHPEGFNGDQLGMLISDHRTAAVTLRADLSRLRPVLAQIGELQLGTGPYRLLGDLTTDYHDVRRLLAAGAVRQALEVYRGPVLADSTAPGIEALRDDLAGQVRACILASADPDLLWDYANRPDATDELEVWLACAAVLPPGSPRLPIAQDRVARLDRELSW